MSHTPHKDKLIAAIANPKCEDHDTALLQEALGAYEEWILQLSQLTVTGKERVWAMTKLLNQYKDFLEVELIARRGSTFIKR